MKAIAGSGLVSCGIMWILKYTKRVTVSLLGKGQSKELLISAETTLKLIVLTCLLKENSQFAFFHFPFLHYCLVTDFPFWGKTWLTASPAWLAVFRDKSGLNHLRFHQHAEPIIRDKVKHCRALIGQRMVTFIDRNSKLLFYFQTLLLVLQSCLVLLPSACCETVCRVADDITAASCGIQLSCS